MDISYVDEAKQALEQRNGLDSPDIEAHWFSTFEDEAGILAAHKHFAAAGLESNEDSQPMEYGGGLTVVWANTRPKAKRPRPIQERLAPDYRRDFRNETPDVKAYWDDRAESFREFTAKKAGAMKRGREEDVEPKGPAYKKWKVPLPSPGFGTPKFLGSKFQSDAASYKAASVPAPPAPPSAAEPMEFVFSDGGKDFDFGTRGNSKKNSPMSIKKGRVPYKEYYETLSPEAKWNAFLKFADYQDSKYNKTGGRKKGRKYYKRKARRAYKKGGYGGRGRGGNNIIYPNVIGRGPYHVAGRNSF